MSAGPPSPLAQYAAQKLRTDLEWRDPQTLAVAAALSGMLPGGSPAPTAAALAVAPLRQLEALGEKLARELLNGTIVVERRAHRRELA